MVRLPSMHGGSKLMIKYWLHVHVVTLANPKWFYIGWPHALGPSFGGNMLSQFSILIAICPRQMVLSRPLFGNSV